jgi:23S rRNA G2445 N2-methylase RlmL
MALASLAHPGNIRDPPMTRDPPDAERLTRSLQLKGWQPANSDVEPLFALVATGDKEAAEAASRALARLGVVAARAAMVRFEIGTPVERARLTRLIGRVAQARSDRALAEFLIDRIADPDDKTARNAALALGKLGELVPRADVERALVARWSAAPGPLRRALAEALGKIGGADALALLAGAAGDDARADDDELARVTREARVKIQRTLGREAPGAIAADVAPAAPLRGLAHCRDGLSKLVAEELAPHGSRVVDDETVSLTLRTPLATLWTSRTMLRFGFPLRVGGAAGSSRASPDAFERAVVDALASDAAWAIFSRFTRGTVRYRLEWADAGHRRALTFRVAAAVAARRPALVNDPTATLWEAIVHEGKHPSVELWPRGLDDPRFAYRVAHVPASSHPTLAAALVRVAGARPDDVVWDPFVGAATELVERAKLGPARALYGTDADEAALARARDNLAAAHVTAELQLADARTFRPALPPTAIITNPPMGRRVLDRHRTGDLYRDFLAHAATLLPHGGRLTWISPRGDETLALATPLGLRVTYRQRVDMSGFWAELQSFTKR